MSLHTMKWLGYPSRAPSYVLFWSSLRGWLFFPITLLVCRQCGLSLQDVSKLGAALPGTVLSAAGVGLQLFPRKQWILSLSRKRSLWKEHFFGWLRPLWQCCLHEMNCSFFLPQVGVPWFWMSPLWALYTGKCGLVKEGILASGLSKWHLPRLINTNTIENISLCVLRKLLTRTEKKTWQSENRRYQGLGWKDWLWDLFTYYLLFCY